MALQLMDKRGALKLRTQKAFRWSFCRRPAHGYPLLGLRISSIKVIMDGQRTAAILRPYLNEPSNKGMLSMDADLIAVEKDPFTCPPDDFLSLNSSATMLAGEWL